MESTEAAARDLRFLHNMRPADDVRQALYTIVNEADTPLGQAFDFVLLVLILASVISTMLETVRSIHAQHAAVFWFAERVFTGIFAAEYALRTAVAKPDARAYVCSLAPSILWRSCRRF